MYGGCYSVKTSAKANTTATTATFNVSTKYQHTELKCFHVKTSAVQAGFETHS